MKGQLQIIGRAALSLVATLAIGGGVTYALFTSNPVTVSQTQLSMGTANLRICDAATSVPAGQNTWQDAITTTISFGGLVPSTTGVDVMTGHDIYLGNDDGSLQDAAGAGTCTTYASGIAPGTSNISLKMLSTISTPICSDPALSSAMELGFTYGSSSPSYQTLDAWVTNTTASGTFAAGEAKKLGMKARVNTSYTNQGQSCTFNITFAGQQ